MMDLECLSSSVRIPTTEDKVFKDECAFTFETADLENGVYICMKNLIAIGPRTFCEYREKTGCQTFLHYKIDKKFKPKDAGSRPTKVALGVPGGFELPQERYTVTEHWALVNLQDGTRLELPAPSADTPKEDTSHLKDLNLPSRLATAINFIQRAESAILVEERASGVEAWEEENMRLISSHAMNLKQLDNGVRIAPSGWKCSQCDLKENLWLNLTDGAINCGRRFWDGTGGNNHAVEHYERTRYPLAVKLGTITSEGAEVFSYPEDDMVVDPMLAEHLAHFGIDIMLMKKTEKTMAELEVSANERLGEWCLLQESNHELAPRYGPGLTGLRNLGNTCYMNAVVQVLFAIPQFRWLYAYQHRAWINQALNEFATTGLTVQGPSQLLIENVGLQFAKLGHGMCSGAYSWLTPANLPELCEGAVPLLPGIRPQLFRRLMGRHNRSFATKHQQDACEFLTFLLDLLDTQAPSATGTKPAQVFNAQGQPVTVPYPSSCVRLAIEDRFECGMTRKVRYSTRNELVLSVPIPMDAMTNRTEYEEWEQAERDAATSGTKLDPAAKIRPRIPFEACLRAWADKERVEDFRTPASIPPGQITHAFRTSRLVNFPDFLCVQLAKFTIGADWLPRKMDVEIELDTESVHETTTPNTFKVDLAQLRSLGGLQPGEELMHDPEEELASGPVEIPTPNPEIFSELMSMGFSSPACHRACMESGNTSLEAATNWIMEHMDDPNLNDPIYRSSDVATTGTTQATSGQSSQLQVDDSSVDMMMAMGFTRTQAIKALRHTNNNLEAAADWAFSNTDALNAPDEEPLNTTAATGSEVNTTAPGATATAPSNSQLTDGASMYELCAFISHMGRSTTDGHYVAHIKRSALAKSIPYEPPVEFLGSPPCDGDSDEWVIFNDEKVAKSEAPPYRHAYIYIFRRVDAPSD
ncbi:Ubiquitinyl hydrolase 1 [Fasciola gigantica]|uniref:Ubiquitin carboxyl-terminal hydrolase n=1 Tax=Fasciola gigantica TaxID=46835 RepID=A0A504YC83_FASGI|nr:Ubiquitinyl hydrolase 1 [Fasciola gigantica]